MRDQLPMRNCAHLSPRAKEMESTSIKPSYSFVADQIPCATSPVLRLAKMLFLIAIILLGIFASWIIASHILTIVNIGEITTVNINAYQDASCTSPLTTIDWGTISPDETKQTVFYLRNEGNVPIIATFNTSNYNPAIFENYVSLSWNYTGTINPSQIVTVSIALYLDPSITGIESFSFNMIVEGIKQ